jgi:hypothetical protein
MSSEKAKTRLANGVMEKEKGAWTKFGNCGRSGRIYDLGRMWSDWLTS